MFRVNVESSGDFKRLLGTKDSSALVFRVRNKKLSMLVASTEVIVVYAVKDEVDAEDCSFGVNREAFGKLYRSGDFAVDVQGNEVCVYFYGVNDALTHVAQFKYLQDVESLYGDLLGVLGAGGVAVNVGALLPLAKLALAQQVSLQVRKGVATVMLSNNVKVFKPVGVNADFSVRYTHLRHLLNNQVVWFKTQQYLCAKQGNLVYVCATDRLVDCDSEYYMVHGGYNLVVKMRMLLRLKPLRELQASHFDFDTMGIDLNKRQLDVRGDVNCQVLLEITDLKKTSDFTQDVLNLPKSILNVLGVFGDQVMLTHRKHFMVMSDTNGVEVYFS